LPGRSAVGSVAGEGVLIGKPMKRAGCGIAIAGLLLSAVGAFVWFVNAMAMEAGRGYVEILGKVGLLGGLVLVVVGSIMAVRRGGPDSRDGQ
jgi:hypothetical protein